MYLIPLKGKFISTFILISLIIFISGLGIYFFYKDNFLDRILEEEYNDASLIDFALEESHDRLEQSGARVANFDIVQRYMIAKNEYGDDQYAAMKQLLSKKIGDFLKNENISTICLTSKTYILLAHPNQDLSYSSTYYQKGFQNRVYSGFESVDERFLIRNVTPVINPQTSEMAGTVILGTYLDEDELLNSTLEELSQKNLDYAIISAQKPVVYSSKPFLDFLRGKDLYSPKNLESIQNIITQKENERYRITIFPFYGTSEEIIGTIIIGKKSEYESNLWAGFIVNWVIFLTIMILIGVLITKHFMKELDASLIKLSKVISKVHSGDIRVKSNIKSPVEIAGIGRKFNGVVTRLNQMLKEEANRRNELKQLNQTARSISSVIDLDTLLHLIMERVITVKEMDNCSIFLKNDKTDKLENRVSGGGSASTISAEMVSKGEEIARKVFQDGSAETINRMEETYNLEKIDDRYTAILSIPFINRGTVFGVMNVFKNYSEAESTGFTNSEINFFKALAGQASISIDNAMLYGQIAEEERMQKELEITSEIKKNIFPKQTPPCEGIQFAHALQQEKVAGGDYYDFIPQQNNKSMGLVLADVMSRGMQAAILTTIARMTIRSSAPYIVDPADIIHTVNRVLKNYMSESCRLRITYILWDGWTKELAFCGVGQSSLLTYQGGSLTEQPYIQAAIGTSGFSPNALHTEKIDMNPGDAFLLFSDGLITARNDSGEWFGISRLKDLFMDHGRSSADEIRDVILSKIEDFTGGNPQLDDFSFIVGKIE
jgi:sigma-B regulation protein RsbU (phosphoserine phosphatase)